MMMMIYYKKAVIYNHISHFKCNRPVFLTNTKTFGYKETVFFERSKDIIQTLHSNEKFRVINHQTVESVWSVACVESQATVAEVEYKVKQKNIPDKRNKEDNSKDGRHSRH
jgi:hypothetical protein